MSDVEAVLAEIEARVAGAPAYERCAKCGAAQSAACHLPLAVCLENRKKIGKDYCPWADDHHEYAAETAWPYDYDGQATEDRARLVAALRSALDFIAINTEFRDLWPPIEARILALLRGSPVVPGGG